MAYCLGLVPLLLVQQHFGIKGQGGGIIGVEQVSPVGSCFGLRQVSLALTGADQVAGGIPIQHEGIDGVNSAVIRSQLHPLLDRVKRFLQPVKALLVGAERAGGIDLDAGKLSPYGGVAGIDLQCLLVGTDGILVGSGVVQFTGGKIGLRRHDVGLGAAGGGGRGVEWRLAPARGSAGAATRHTQDQQGQEQDAIRVGLALDRMEVEGLAGLDLAHIRVWESRWRQGVPEAVRQ